MPEAGARRVDEHQIAHVDEAVLVVDDAVGRRRAVRVIGSAHALWAERAHVQPNRGGARTPVVQKSDGTMRIFLVAAEVRDVRHARLGRRRRRIAVLIVRRRWIIVHGILHMDHQHPRLGLIGNGPSFDRDRTLRRLMRIVQQARRLAQLLGAQSLGVGRVRRATIGRATIGRATIGRATIGRRADRDCGRRAEQRAQHEAGPWFRHFHLKELTWLARSRAMRKHAVNFRNFHCPAHKYFARLAPRDLR